jgi:hypothetical protein
MLMVLANTVDEFESLERELKSLMDERSNRWNGLIHEFFDTGSYSRQGAGVRAAIAGGDV